MWLKQDHYDVLDEETVRAKCPHCGSTVRFQLIELAQRETRTFSNRFARLLMGEMKTTVRMHKHPLKSAGFKVLKAPDVPSVLVELGYVSNKGDR